MTETRLIEGVETGRLRRILAHLKAGVLLTDADGKITSANPAAGRLLRIEPELLTGKLLDDFICSDELLIPLPGKRGDDDGGDVQEFVEKYPAYGQTPLNITLIPEFDQQGQATGAVVLLQLAPEELEPAGKGTSRWQVIENWLSKRTAELEESESRYRLLATMTSDYAASVKVSSDGTLTTEWIVGSFEEVTGYPVQFNQPARLRSTHPEDLDRQRGDIARTLQNENTTSEIRTKRLDGSDVWLRISRKPIWDEAQQRVTRFLVVGQDITERKLAEQALAESEQRYRQLSSMTSDYAASILVNEDGTTTTEWIAGSVKEVTGYDVEAHTPNDLIRTHPEDLQRQQDDIARTLRGEDTVTEFRTYRSDDTLAWIRVSRQPIWDDARQRVTKYLVVGQDITERKLAEKALAESEWRYKLLSSMTSDYAASILVNEDGTMTNEWAVGSSEEITGYPTMIGEPATNESTHPDDRGQQLRDLERTFQGEPTVTEFRAVKPDGSLVWLRASRKPFFDEEEGRVTRFISVVKNVTEYKHAEEELRRNQVRQAELDGIRKTVATLAHEINNPLTGVIALLQMGLEHDTDPAELREMMTDAYEAAKSIRDVVVKLQMLRRPSYRPYLTKGEILDIRDGDGD